MPPALITRLLRLHEGCRLHAYACPAGKLTIGWGRNIDATGPGLTQDEADLLLSHDIARCEVELVTTYPWTVHLDAVRHAVLLDLLFNLGLPKFKQFRRTLAAIEAGDYTGAAGHLLNSQWARQVGTRAQRLAGMLATGTIPPELGA